MCWDYINIYVVVPLRRSLAEYFFNFRGWFRKLTYTASCTIYSSNSLPLTQITYFWMSKYLFYQTEICRTSNYVQLFGNSKIKQEFMTMESSNYCLLSSSRRSRIYVKHPPACVNFCVFYRALMRCNRCMKKVPCTSMVQCYARHSLGLSPVIELKRGALAYKLVPVINTRQQLSWQDRQIDDPNHLPATSLKVAPSWGRCIEWRSTPVEFPFAKESSDVNLDLNYWTIKQ